MIAMAAFLYSGTVAGTGRTASAFRVCRVPRSSARRRHPQRRARPQHGHAVRRARRVEIWRGPVAVENGTRRRQDETMDPVAELDAGAAVDEEGVIAGDADREQQRDLGPRLRVRRGRVADYGDEATVAPGDGQVHSVRAPV